MTIDKKSLSEHWSIAYKHKDEQKFHLIRNPEWAWAADPFLVEYAGEIYLFAELFLYKSERNGVIGYCKWNGNGFDEWIVSMDKHWHLSYPNVFVQDGKLFLVPESYQRDDISLYVLESFPDKWQRVNTLVDNVACVDTTFVDDGDSKYMYTFAPSFVENGGDLLLYKVLGSITSRACSCIKIMNITNNKEYARPAGHVFLSSKGKLIRPAQNCASGYGTGITFMEIDSIEPTYKEHVVAYIGPENIEVENQPVDIKYTGIHTYNAIDDLEVIDLKYSVSNEEEQEARERIRKVFVDKY